jgi:hypothetical protein
MTCKARDLDPVESNCSIRRRVSLGDEAERQLA